MPPKKTTTHIKPINIPDGLWQEIQASIDAQGLPSFGAFAKMAFRTLLDRFEREKQLNRLLDDPETINQLLQTLEQKQAANKTAEPPGTYRNKKP